MQLAASHPWVGLVGTEAVERLFGAQRCDPAVPLPSGTEQCFQLVLSTWEAEAAAAVRWKLPEPLCKLLRESRVSVQSRRALHWCLLLHVPPGCSLGQRSCKCA